MRSNVSKLILYCFITVVMITGKPLTAQTLKNAIQLTESEQFEQAGLLYRKLIGENPATGLNYYYAGENIMKSYFADSANVSFKESADSALLLYRTGNEKDPRNPLNLVGMGAIKLLEKDKAGSKVLFDQAYEKTQTALS